MATNKFTVRVAAHLI